MRIFYLMLVDAHSDYRYRRSDHVCTLTMSFFSEYILISQLSKSVFYGHDYFPLLGYIFLQFSEAPLDFRK